MRVDGRSHNSILYTSSITNEATFKQLFSPSYWPEPTANYAALFCGQSYNADFKICDCFPIEQDALNQSGLQLFDTLNKPVKLKQINGPFALRNLQDYNAKAYFIAQAMIFEYEAKGLKNKTVNQIFCDVDLIDEYLFASYIFNIIDRIWFTRKESNNTFICISAPSCTGKTQLAFVIDCFSRFQFAVHSSAHFALYQFPSFKPRFHSVLHIICCDSKQSIYSSLSYSLPVLSLLKDNLKELLGDNRSKNVISGTHLGKIVDSFKFKCLGFLRTIFLQREKGDPWTEKNTEDLFPSLSLNEFKIFIDEISIGQNNDALPIVVCLDEFGSVHQSEELRSDEVDHLFLLRNLLRESGCVVFTMGTNSRATNLINVDGLGGDSGKSVELSWVYLLTELPRFPYGILTQSYPNALKLLNLHYALKRWLFRSCNFANMNSTDPILTSSISGILDIFLHEFNEIQDLTVQVVDILAKVFDQLQTRIKDRKAIDKKLGYIGQYFLHFACYKY
jgi:hypothetical protein